MGSDTSVVDEGLVVGLTEDGALRLRRQSGREVSITNGDVSLVPKQQI
jgi:biotin-(acetyl-CoA carboxylase) ligase